MVRALPRKITCPQELYITLHLLIMSSNGPLLKRNVEKIVIHRGVDVLISLVTWILSISDQSVLSVHRNCLHFIKTHRADGYTCKAKVLEKDVIVPATVGFKSDSVEFFTSLCMRGLNWNQFQKFGIQWNFRYNSLASG